jgi:tetratricopeptide (TPR) repeat protein
MMRARCLALALATVVTLGCGHAGWNSGDAPVATDDRDWRALTSPHFVLYTNQGDFMARQVSEELERDVRVLQAIAFPRLSLPADRTDVVLMDGTQLRQLSGDSQVAGFFHASDDVTEEPHLLLVEVPPDGLLASLGRLRETVLHEFTHGFVRRSVPRAPAWLGEGLASYWETMEIETDAPEVIVGRPPRLGVLVVDWTPLGEIVASSQQFYARKDRSPAYASAWGAVHYLMEQSPERLAAYEQALRQGRDEKAAWRDTIGIAPEELDRRMRTLYAADAPLAHRAPRPTLGASDPDAVRALLPADVHLLWARVARASDATAWARIQPEVARAAQLAPDTRDVIIWRAQLEATQGQLGVAATQLEGALAAHPDDGVLLEQLAQLRIEEQLRRPDAERDFAPLDGLFARLRRASPSATALALAAHFEGTRRGLEAALPLAESAVARNPDCIGCLELLASVRHGLHDDAGAAEAIGRAITAWPHEKAPTALLERLARYRQAAAAPAR